MRLFVLSPIRIYREGLAHVLANRAGFEVVGTASQIEGLAALLPRTPLDVVLYDLRSQSGILGLRRLARYDGLSVVALGLAESPHDVIACAEAGIAGYLTDNGTLEELEHRIEDAANGRFECPPEVAAGLLRRLASSGGTSSGRDDVDWRTLTSRELEVAALLEEGLSNQQIAGRLTIQLATVKNHVHSILTKMGTRSRLDAVVALRSAPRGARL